MSADEEDKETEQDQTGKLTKYKKANELKERLKNINTHIHQNTYETEKNALFCSYIIVGNDSSHCFSCITSDSFLNGQLAQL